MQMISVRSVIFQSAHGHTSVGRPTLFAVFIAIAATHSEAVAIPRSQQQVPLLHQAHLRFPQQGAAKIGTYGFDEKGENRSISPGDDFYEFANGKYVAHLNMPEDESSWGSFDILNRQSLEWVRGILEADVKAGGKMGMFYASYMNETLVESLDISPIKSTLAAVAAIRNATDFASLSGRSTSSFLPSPFGVGVSPDAKDINSYSVMVDQGGLGLPRDYYLKPRFSKKKAAYAKYVATLLDMVGWPEAKKASAQVLALEDKLANASWTEAACRDPVANYNPMKSVADLQSHAPGFEWATFLQEAGDLPRSSNLVVGALGGVIGMAKILGETDTDVLRSYTAFHFVSQVAPILSARFVSEAFKFSQALSGQEKLSPRWKRGVNSLNAHMGEAVGSEFVKKYFPASSKLQVEKLTLALKKAFKTRIQNVAWMTNATKQKALDKLERFSIQVGYPKKFRDYTDLRVDAQDLYGNVKRSIHFDWKRMLDKLGKQVDRDEWEMTPQTVNAYNMPQFNQVVFPAAILQPPFFDPAADMAVNFGGIGGVIGHEMTHGFDDQGRHYDADGQLKDWWAETDAKEFQKRADAYGRQFATFDLGLPSAHIKPDLTMGEDIADLGGLNLALDAYRAYSSAKEPIGSYILANSPSARLEGARRVYLGWAQVWREKQRPDALLNQLASDPHAPAKARVDIPSRNTDAWYKAFDVQEGQKLFLPASERVAIW